MKWFSVWFTFIIVILMLLGCSTETIAPPPYTEELPAVLTVGDTIPEPTGEVILTITGNLEQNETIQLDMQTLESFGTVSFTVDDKQAEGEVVTFEGVLVSRLLDVAQLDPSAASLRTVALNDYAIEIPLDDVVDYPVLLATKVNGERMTIERYGPTRIIYPYHAYELDPVIYDPRWIWQLATIEVR